MVCNVFRNLQQIKIEKKNKIAIQNNTNPKPIYLLYHCYKFTRHSLITNDPFKRSLLTSGYIKGFSSSSTWDNFENLWLIIRLIFTYFKRRFSLSRSDSEWCPSVILSCDWFLFEQVKFSWYGVSIMFYYSITVIFYECILSLPFPSHLFSLTWWITLAYN